MEMKISWLLVVLAVFLLLMIIQGFQKGMVRTAISMFSLVIVVIATGWLNPYVSDYIRESTDWQEEIQNTCAQGIFSVLEEEEGLTAGAQAGFIEELPLPAVMKDKLVENNNTEVYQRFAVESFSDYLAGYMAYGIVNGIAYLISFLIVTMVLKLILYAVELLTELPVVGTLNHLGGMVLGALQGILWIWIFFLAVALLCNTPAGSYLYGVIREDAILSQIYDSNFLLSIVMRIVA